jgi:hypothetical protein
MLRVVEARLKFEIVGLEILWDARSALGGYGMARTRSRSVSLDRDRNKYRGSAEKQGELKMLERVVSAREDVGA